MLYDETYIAEYERLVLEGHPPDDAHILAIEVADAVYRKERERLNRG
jgi:hypothetical protein